MEYNVVIGGVQLAKAGRVEMTNRLITMAEERHIGFDGMPEEARAGVLGALDGCFQILELKYEIPFDLIGDKPELRTINWVILFGLQTMALALLFVSYPDDRGRDGGDRIWLSQEKTQKLREHLAGIVSWEGIMEAADMLILIPSTGESTRKASVGEIIRGHASRPALTA